MKKYPHVVTILHMMEPIDFYCKIYEKLQYREEEIVFLMRPLRWFLRWLATWHIKHSRSFRHYNTNRKKSDVIVSLTTFPERINIVHLVVLSMLNQTCLPKKIILWLSKTQFDEVSLPYRLTSLKNDVFEIRMVDKDIRSYKKSYYVLKEYPYEQVLLIDDDLFYPTNTIELLLNAQSKHPNTLICRYGGVMKYNLGEPMSYNSWWKEEIEESSDKHFFFGTGGGTLLSHSILYDDVDNIELALSLAPMADDVWMNAMVNLKKTPKFKVRYGLILPIYIKTNKSLTSKNVGLNQNDVQIRNVREYYLKNLQIDPFPEL